MTLPIPTFLKRHPCNNDNNILPRDKLFHAFYVFQNLMVIRALVKMTTQEFTGVYGQHQLTTDTTNEKNSTPASGNRTRTPRDQDYGFSLLLL